MYLAALLINIPTINEYTILLILYKIVNNIIFCENLIIKLIKFNLVPLNHNIFNLILLLNSKA